MDTGALNPPGTGVGGLVKLLWRWLHWWQGGWDHLCVIPLSLLGKKWGGVFEMRKSRL